MHEFITPVGRLVQGSFKLEPKVDPNTNQPKLNDQGVPVKECFFALAIPKTDPNFNTVWAAMSAAAREKYPTIFDANGNCTNPKFSWKYQDGDGVDGNGQSVKDKPGFAGHHILKFATQYPPKCYPHGKYDAMNQYADPDQHIKRGYYIRVAGMVRDNGVDLNNRNGHRPGIFLSPNLVEFIAFGEEIQSGPDASKVFGGAAPIGALPAGASATPLVGSAGPQGGPSLPGGTPGTPSLPGAASGPVGGPSLPGAGPVAQGGPSLPGSGPAATGGPVLPGSGPSLPAGPGAPPTGPQYVMQPSAGGMTREQLLAQGWTDALLLQHGHMVQAG